jgi:hypothetical protein
MKKIRPLSDYKYGKIFGKEALKDRKHFKKQKRIANEKIKFILSKDDIKMIVEILKDWKEGLIEMKLKYGKISKLIKRFERK